MKPNPPDGSLFRRFDPDIAHRTTGEILSHPDYARVRTVYMVRTRAINEIGRFPGNWSSTAYRSAAIGAIVCLHAGYDPNDRATWPTLARFKAAAGAIGLSSRRQLDDIVARLVATGYISLDPSDADRRLRLVRPTEKLLAWDLEFLCTYYDILQMLYPDGGYEIAVRRDPHFYRIHRRGALKIFPVIGRFIMQNAALLPFMQMNGGTSILMALISTTPSGELAPLREVTLTSLKERFGISRSHVRNVIALAEAQNLVTRIGTGRKWLNLTSRGLDALDQFIADTLASHDLTFRIAMNEMRRAPSPADRS